MTKPEFETPTIDTAGRVPIDIDRLIVTKILATANSGGGKGWLLRRILEQTYGHVPHVVFDPEGEFHTLREKYGYLLFGPDGDAPAHLEHASRMPAKILQTGCSAIIDLSEMRITDELDERAEYIRRFLTALMQTPRAQWKPILVFLDEVHLWAPEKGVREAVSTAAVLDFMTRGRKRGFGAVVATQRLTEFHKTAAAECQNRLVGRTSLDVDQQRAGKTLGMKPSDYRGLSDLEDGQFYAFGPALSKQVQLVQVGQTVTSHHKVGGRVHVTPAPASIKRMLAEFSDIPKEVAKETSELETLKRDYLALLEESQKLRTQAMPDSMQSLEIERLKDVAQRYMDTNKQASDTIRELEGRLEKQEADFEAIWESVAEAFNAIADRAIAARNSVIDRVEMLIENERSRNSSLFGDPNIGKLALNNATVASRLTSDATYETNNLIEHERGAELSKPARALLTALVQFGPMSRKRAMKLACYRPGGAVTEAFALFNREGWVEKQADDTIAITAAGRKALGTWEKLPTGRALRERVLNDSSNSAADTAILKAVISAYPASISRAKAMEIAGYRPGGAVTEAFAKWTRYGYILSPAKGHVVASKDLF